MATSPVPIEVGPMDQSRFERIEALVDTGATYTVVPRDVLERLGISVDPVNRRLVPIELLLIRFGLE